MSKKQYGLNVTGIIRVFRKDKLIEGKNKKKYEITDVWFNTSEQEENGEWFNKSTNLIFNRELDKPENNTLINILDAFPIITGSGKWRRIAIYVKDYERVDNIE